MVVPRKEILDSDTILVIQDFVNSLYPLDATLIHLKTTITMAASLCIRFVKIIPDKHLPTFNLFFQIHAVFLQVGEMSLLGFE